MQDYSGVVFRQHVHREVVRSERVHEERVVVVELQVRDGRVRGPRRSRCSPRTRPCPPFGARGEPGPSRVRSLGLGFAAVGC